MMDIVPPNPSLGPKTVRIDWKLPARLRRPVVKREFQSARFTRKALYEDVAMHTTDVHTKQLPKLKVSTPPYTGRVIRQQTGAGQLVPQDEARFAKRPAKLRHQYKHIAMSPTRQTVRRSRQAASTALRGERDIPFEWQAVPSSSITKPPLFKRTREVLQPSRRLALPIHFAFWPFTKRQPADRLKKKVLQRTYE